jgi:nickel-type superoxide dismutase maturation protease
MVGTQTYHGSANRRSVVFALVASLIGTLVWAWWRPFRVAVEGESMRPTFEPGDWLVASRRGRIHVGSIVVLVHPERPGFELIKRVEAVPARRTDANGGYRVAGDNLGASTDSRTFGPVRRDAVLGVVRFRYGRRSRVGAAPARIARRHDG